MGSTINAARQLASGTERLAEIFQRAGAQLQEVVPDFCLIGDGLGEEARSVAELLLAWREVGEVGVVFASHMLDVSTGMSALVSKMELERTQRLAEAQRLARTLTESTERKPRTWLERVTKSAGTSEEAVLKRKDQEVVVTTCLESVMSRMEAVRLEGRRTVADAVAHARADAKAVGEKIVSLKTGWRGGLSHGAVGESSLLRLLQRSSEAPWVVKDGAQEPWLRARSIASPPRRRSSEEDVGVGEQPLRTSEGSREEAGRAGAPGEPIDSRPSPQPPPAHEDAAQADVEGDAVAEEAALQALQNVTEFLSPRSAMNVNFWRMPIGDLSDDDTNPEEIEESCLTREDGSHIEADGGNADESVEVEEASLQCEQSADDLSQSNGGIEQRIDSTDDHRPSSNDGGIEQQGQSTDDHRPELEEFHQKESVSSPFEDPVSLPFDRNGVESPAGARQELDHASSGQHEMQIDAVDGQPHDVEGQADPRMQDEEADSITSAGASLSYSAQDTFM